MTPDEVLALAKEGNPKILTAIMNRSTQSHGISVRVAQKQGCLHILLEGEAIANSSSLVTFVEGSLNKLNVNPELPVKVYGRQQGQKSIAWSHDLHRQNPQHPSSPSEAPDNADAYPSSVAVNSSSDPFSSSTPPSVDSSFDESKSAEDEASSNPLGFTPSAAPEHSIEPNDSSIPQQESATPMHSPSDDSRPDELAPNASTPDESAPHGSAHDASQSAHDESSVGQPPATSPPNAGFWGIDDPWNSPEESSGADSPQPEVSPIDSPQPEPSQVDSSITEPLPSEASQETPVPSSSFKSPEEEPSIAVSTAMPEEGEQSLAASSLEEGISEEGISTEGISEEGISEEGVSNDALATMDQPNTMGAFASDQPAEANSTDDDLDTPMETNSPEMVDTPNANADLENADLFEEQDESFDFQDMMKRPEALVILLFAIALYIWQIYTALATKAAPEGSVSGQELAERLGVSKSTISRRKFDVDFSEWSSSQDPDGIAWAYDSGAFIPQMPDFNAN